jgi:hypothetical protein
VFVVWDSHHHECIATMVANGYFGVTWRSTRGGPHCPDERQLATIGHSPASLGQGRLPSPRYGSWSVIRCRV